MAEPLRFYFDFVSAYSYVAMNLVDEVAARYGREVDWHCVGLPDIMARQEITSPRDQPAKFAHNSRDFPRLCEITDLPVNFPPEVPPYGANLHRLAFWRLKARDPALAKRFARAVDNRYFGRGLEVRTAEQLIDACTVHGADIDADEIRAAEDDTAARAALDAAFERAIADGMFGAPFVVLDGETFWGADRLQHVEHRLRQAAGASAPAGFVPVEVGGGYNAVNGPYLRRENGDGTVTFGLRAEPRHGNPGGTMHGGLLVSFMDAAFSQTVLYAVGQVGMLPTVAMSTDFVAPVSAGDWVESRVDVVRQTRNLVFLRGTAVVGDTPVVSCNAVYKAPRAAAG